MPKELTLADVEAFLRAHPQIRHSAQMVRGKMSVRFLDMNNSQSVGVQRDNLEDALREAMELVQ